MSQNQIKSLIAMLDEAYAGPAWHGPCLKGSLRGVTHREAAWRPARGRHNIWELGVHAAYWKYAARRQILGETAHNFCEPGHNWFPRPPKPGDAGEGEKQWRSDLALLARMHKELRDAVRTLADSALARHPRGSKYTIRRIIAGAAMHDVYHAGQIQLFKRLREKR
jgi:hypothetical protein